MRRGLLVAFAILGLTACGQKGDSETAAVGAARGAAASPYAGTCLEMAAAKNWPEASRLCTMALNADPNDQKVKAALDGANAALDAGEAADDAAEEAEEALPN